MRIRLSIFWAITVSFFLASFGFAQPVYFESAQPDSKLSQVDNRFAFDLYSHLASNQGNIFFSPYSLSSALEMAYEGARGDTAQEMSSVLGLNADNAVRRSEVSAFIQQINAKDKPYELSVANALWAEKTYLFKNDYLSLLKNAYFAEARNLDFVSNSEASRVTINSWVSDKTKNRINDLLPAGSITPDTRLVLTDAVYFKGKWETPFVKQFTELETYWITPNQSVQTDMMRLTETFSYFDNDQFQILKLPYQGEDFTMLIILPRSKDIQGLEKVLTQEMFLQWQKGMYPQKVNIFLPKFKFDSSYEMSNILTKMGMKLAFDGNNADFSGMAPKIPGKNFFIGGVFHKAWIDTNEEGTEAAAATGVDMMAGATAQEEPEPKDFNANHPFVFVIQDNKTGHILFMGRVSDPREK